MSEENNIFDYLAWRGDLSFMKDSFNEIDALVFAVLSYLNWDNAANTASWDETIAPALKITATPMIEKDDKAESLGLIDKEQILEMLKILGDTERFQEVQIAGYSYKCDEEITLQFAAASFLLPNDGLVVAFRGTDDTLVGWKEDLNMSYAPFVPAQEEAKKYLEQAATAYPEHHIYITGHSKGGNLAIYAAVNAESATKNRILGVYNNDGPGFHHEFLTTEAYKSMSHLLHTFIPNSSVVGMLLEHEESYQVIASTAKAFLQHAPLSWEILGTKFIYLEERSEFGKHSDAVISNWLATCSDAEKAEFVDALFDILASGRAKSLREITEGEFFVHWWHMLKTFNGMDKEKRELLSNLLKRLMIELKNEAVRDNKFLKKRSLSEKSPQN